MTIVPTVLVAGLVAAGIAAPARAQSFGPVAGIGFPTVTGIGAAAERAAARPSGLVGGFIAITIRGPLAVKAEVIATQERTTIEKVVEDRLTYASVSIFARYRVWRSGSRLMLAAVGGGTYRDLLKAREVISGESSDVSPGVRGSETGPTIGVDVDVHAHWTGGFRYFRARRGLYRTASGSTTGHHSVVQASIAYRFR